MTTFLEARDIMFDHFRAVWLAGAGSIAGEVPPVEYEGITAEQLTFRRNTYARLVVRPAFGNQFAFGSSEGFGYNEYENTGILFIDIFSPTSDNSSKDVGIALGEMVLTAFRRSGAQERVWFSEQTLTTPPREKAYYHVQIRIRYRYEQAA